jgi:hypothetical protein
MIPSHCKLLSSKAMVVNVVEKSGRSASSAVRLAAAKKKGNYLQAQFHRLKAQRGPKKAIMAVVASI